jgi:hypothetical protein
MTDDIQHKKNYGRLTLESNSLNISFAVSFHAANNIIIIIL